RKFCVPRYLRPVHRLQVEMLEVVHLKSLGLCSWLGVDELQFVSAPEDRPGPGFRAHADPVEAGWGPERAICLDGDFEAARVERSDSGFVELEQGLAAGADDEPLPMPVQGGPASRDRVGQLVGGPELATIGADADKVRVAEAADRVGAVLLTAGPEVAAGEAAEHSRPAGVGSLALQRVEDLFDRVSHATACRRSL